MAHTMDNMKRANQSLAVIFRLVLFISMIILGLVRSPALAGDPQFSALWGRSGERWRPESRLPDFSYAGYHRGEKQIPTLKGDVNVKDFGAIGDGRSDDTEAFKKAIKAAKGQVIVVPSGHYKITDILYISASRTCLKGAGRRKSVLIFPTPLNEIKPNWGATTGGRRTSNYSWSGGFIRITGSFSDQKLAEVKAMATRGDRSLVVSKTEHFSSGDEVRLVMTDTQDNTLAQHLYAGDTGPIENLKGRIRESFIFRIEKVDVGRKRIHFDRPLRTDVLLEWKPRLLPATSSVEEVGIDDLGFEFPNTPYKGHFTERGYNAMAMSGVRNCWASNLWIHNADSGIFIGGTNITLQNILIDSEREAEPSHHSTGHHAIMLGGQDNLLKDFELRTRFMHDITVTSGSAGNVASTSCGVDLALDHHCRAPHANLFTNIDLGEGSRMFMSGGGSALGRHSAAYETFWCIRARRPQSWPAGWGPDLMNLVGITTKQMSVTEPGGKWFEAINPDLLHPCNLYQSQLDRRLKKLQHGRGLQSP